MSVRVNCVELEMWKEKLNLYIFTRKVEVFEEIMIEKQMFEGESVAAVVWIQREREKEREREWLGEAFVYFHFSFNSLSVSPCFLVFQREGRGSLIINFFFFYL